jgi:hypothetical protein
MRAVDHAPDDVRGLVAEERRRQHLDLVIGLEAEWPRKAPAKRGEDVPQVGAEIREPTVEPEVEHDIDQRVAQPLLQRVVAAVGRRVGVDVLGRNRRPHEDEAVVEVAPAEGLHRDRVEERLGALRLLVVYEEPDIVELHVLPQQLAVGAVEAGKPVFALDVVGGFLRAAVVEVDAVARDVLDGKPVARLEVPLGRARAFAKHRVVVVEAFEQQAGDAARLDGDGVRRGDRGGGGDRRGHGAVARRRRFDADSRWERRVTYGGSGAAPPAGAPGPLARQ